MTNPLYGKIFYHGLLYGEELEISPTYEVFFSGCNLRCSFCYLKDKIFTDRETYTHPQEVAKIVQNCVEAASISLVGGEATLSIDFWKPILDANTRNLPVVLNSNFSFSPKRYTQIESSIDIFIANDHFGNDRCASEIAKAFHYRERIEQNLLWAARTGKKLIVRHLLLPGHLDCCYRPVLNWVKENLNPYKNVQFHLMTNFYDFFGDSGLKQHVLETSVNQAETWFKESGLQGIDVQKNRKICNTRTAETSAGIEAEIEIDTDGRVILKHLTQEMLEVALHLNPENQNIQKRIQMIHGVQNETRDIGSD